MKTSGRRQTDWGAPEFAPDSPLEQKGIEPSVPLRWCDGSRPHPWYDAVRRPDEINIEEGGDPNAPTGETLALDAGGRGRSAAGRLWSSERPQT